MVYTNLLESSRYIRFSSTEEKSLWYIIMWHSFHMHVSFLTEYFHNVAFSYPFLVFRMDRLQCTLQLLRVIIIHASFSLRVVQMSILLIRYPLAETTFGSFWIKHNCTEVMRIPLKLWLLKKSTFSVSTPISLCSWHLRIHKLYISESVEQNLSHQPHKLVTWFEITSNYHKRNRQNLSLFGYLL